MDSIAVGYTFGNTRVAFVGFTIGFVIGFTIGLVIGFAIVFSLTFLYVMEFTSVFKDFWFFIFV